MNKKVLMSVMALLMLFVVAPVMAAPAVKIDYEADVSLTIIDPGEEWTTNGGILHIKGVIAEGSFVSDLGIEGDMLKEFDLTLNLNTGKGTLHGKFVLTVTVGGVGTLKGSFMGIITDYDELAGTVVGHGTGDFEGAKTMGTWEGEVDFGLGTIENTLDAIILSPKG